MGVSRTSKLPSPVQTPNHRIPNTIYQVPLVSVPRNSVPVDSATLCSVIGCVAMFAACPFTIVDFATMGRAPENSKHILLEFQI